jgi:predicted phage terminase large subunit-like protein
LVAFGEYVHPWWKAARHHQLVAEKLEQVARFIETRGREGIGRLIVEMPPRHGKTELASRLFPAWVLGRLPDSRVILTSYGADLAQDSSRAVRQVVTSTGFAAVFGTLSALDMAVELSDDSRAKSNWELAAPARGGVVAAGVGGGITGKGAHLLVIDDPFKNREEAESEAHRRAVMKWYSSSAYTRLEDGGAVVIMHTRWHREDLTGQLLKTMVHDGLADQWEVVCMPALAYEAEEYAVSAEAQRQAMLAGLWVDQADSLGRAPGEALWGEKYDALALQKIRVNLEAQGSLMDWYALYQQQPRPNEGGFFSSQNLVVIDALPSSPSTGSGSEGGEKLRWVRYMDLALGEKATSDFNACVALALGKDGTVYARDMIRVQQWGLFKEKVIQAMLAEWEIGTVWGVEDVAFQALAWQEFMADARLAQVAIRRVKPRGDKVERARPLQTRAEAGRLKLVRGPWTEQFIMECLDFPNGRHDDQVDSASGGLQMLASGSGGRVTVTENPFYT